MDGTMDQMLRDDAISFIFVCTELLQRCPCFFCRIWRLNSPKVSHHVMMRCITMPSVPHHPNSSWLHKDTEIFMRDLLKNEGLSLEFNIRQPSSSSLPHGDFYIFFLPRKRKIASESLSRVSMCASEYVCPLPNCVAFKTVAPKLNSGFCCIFFFHF